jgi:D-alanyl-lipoteichoic acid acyltransferase DltB (MBOAT superfamily)
MNFISVQYIAFLGVAYGLYWSLRGVEIRKYVLTGLSYIFYAAWDWRFCGLMLFVTMNAYLTARVLESKTRKIRRSALWLSITIDLMVLGFFKYFGFFVSSFERLLSSVGVETTGPVMAVILPIGISFYTFHAISYVVDVYRGKIFAASSFNDIALYIAFFPQLIAGPIVRSRSFLPQLNCERRFSLKLQARGFRLIILGLIYKAVIANNLSELCDPVFASVTSHRPPELLLATVAYYGQIYFDFAGYSCLAIGSARLFGYRLPRNFNYPYLAASLSEFWKRWHMSLSFWLRDYLYFSLGGNRGSTSHIARNLMITMILGGLWHGASWNFVLWGVIHGVGLCGHKLWVAFRSRAIPRWMGWDSLIWKIFSVTLTQLIVLLAWVFFRCEQFDDALYIFRTIVSPSTFLGFGLRTITMWVLILIALDHYFGGIRRISHRVISVTIDEGYWLALGVLAAIALTMVPLSQRAFIYFQF